MALRNSPVEQPYVHGPARAQHSAGSARPRSGTGPAARGRWRAASRRNPPRTGSSWPGAGWYAAASAALPLRIELTSPISPPSRVGPTTAPPRREDCAPLGASWGGGGGRVPRPGAREGHDRPLHARPRRGPKSTVAAVSRPSASRPWGTWGRRYRFVTIGPVWGPPASPGLGMRHGVLPARLGGVMGFGRNVGGVGERRGREPEHEARGGGGRLDLDRSALGLGPARGRS